MQGLHGFSLDQTFLNFLHFYEKNLAKRKRFTKDVLKKKKNPGEILKCSEKNTKI